MTSECSLPSLQVAGRRTRLTPRSASRSDTSVSPRCAADSTVGIGFNVPLGGDKVMISDKVDIELDVHLVEPA
jgi:hypothetical protein